MIFCDMRTERCAWTVVLMEGIVIFECIPSINVYTGMGGEHRGILKWAARTLHDP